MNNRLFSYKGDPYVMLLMMPYDLLYYQIPLLPILLVREQIDMRHGESLQHRKKAKCDVINTKCPYRQLNPTENIPKTSRRPHRLLIFPYNIPHNTLLNVST